MWTVDFMEGPKLGCQLSRFKFYGCGGVGGHRTFLGTPRPPHAGAATGAGRADGEENSH